MGLGNSRMRSSPSPRAGPHQRRCRSIKRTISSLLICGASSSSSSSRSPNQMDDYPAELLVDSVEHGLQEKLKFSSKDSNFSQGIGADLTSSKTENGVSSVRCIAASENPTPEVSPSNVEPRDKGKCLSENRELVASHQSITNFRGNESASTSYVNHPSPNCVPENEMAHMDAENGINISMNGGSSQVSERLNNSSSLPSHGLGEFSLDGVSVENNVHDALDFSSSDFGSSVVSDSPIDFHLLRDNTLPEGMPSDLGFLVSEREQIRQDENLLHVDVMSISSNMLSSNSAEISSREARRNSRRLFWDAFSRRNSRRHTDSRTFVISPNDSEHLRSRDRWLLDFSGDFLSDEVGGDFRSHGSRVQSSNEQQWRSRSEIWERLRSSLDSTDHRTAVCPRGIHADGSCSCQPGLSAEESGARAGISRIVMLAEALFEVLDQIHRQPMSLSLSMVSLPAPESVVDSFPVKTHGKTERLDYADDVLQCYICLAEYEEGDKIRVLPCHHEYHISCIDKWLKEIHGVCPLCRGDVREGFTDVSVSN